MSTFAKRLPVFVLVGLMLIMIGSSLDKGTFAQESTPDPAATETAIPDDTGLTETETPASPDTGGALPVDRPVIVGSLNGIPVEGIAGSFCWPQADTSTPQCSFVDDPQPTTPISVVNGDAIVFSTEPVSPAPTTFIGILLDDRNADGEPQEINLSNLGGIFTVDNLSEGSHRLQVDALYPGEEQNQPFVSYVYLLSVGGAAPVETPTETPSDVVVETETATPDGGVVPEATETATPGDVVIDVTPTETLAGDPGLVPTEDATQTQLAVEFEQTNIAATVTACAVSPETCVTPTETPADATPIDVTPTETAAEAATETPIETPTETPTEVPTEAPTATVVEPTAVPPTEVPTLEPTFTPTPVAPADGTPILLQPTPIVVAGTAINVTVPIPQARIIVGGRTYEPVAINACAGSESTEYICLTQPLNVSVPRVYAAPGDAAQVTFSASRPTGITLSVLSSDGSRVIGTAQIRPDNLTLFNLPPVVGNYVISVEFVYPEGKATYFFRLGIGT